VDLAFATGTLLGADKVDWQPVGRPSTAGPDPSETVGPDAVPMGDSPRMEVDENGSSPE